MRNISLRNNDFADRAAEAMARMWRAAGSGVPIEGVTNNGIDPLHLSIRSRMGVSHVYDCIWGWRRCINLQNTVQGANSPFILEDMLYAFINADYLHQMKGLSCLLSRASNSSPSKTRFRIRKQNFSRNNQLLLHI